MREASSNPDSGADGARATARRRRNRAGDERRELVLRAAVDQFGRFGYAGTSIATIARAAGITDSGVLHHFPTKLALYRAIILGRGERFTDGFEGSEPGDDIARRLVAGMVAALADPALVRLQAMLEGEMLIEGHPLREEYVQSQHDAIDALARHLCELDPSLRPAEAERLALHALATLKGLRAQWALMPDRVDLAAEASAALEAVFRGAVTPH